MTKPTLQRIAEALEDGDGPDLDELLQDESIAPRLTLEERAQLEVIVRWARLPRFESALSLIEAADAHADNYEGQDVPANEVRAAITNAFYAGARFIVKGQ